MLHALPFNEMQKEPVCQWRIFFQTGGDYLVATLGISLYVGSTCTHAIRARPRIVSHAFFVPSVATVAQMTSWPCDGTGVNYLFQSG